MKRPTIIVVDDEKEWLKYVENKLNRIGKDFDIMVESFSSFADAGTRIEQHPINYDLLITDIFPSQTSDEATGLEFAKFVRNRNIPVIIITGGITGRERDYVAAILKNEKFKIVFEKGTIDRFKFMNLVEEILKKIIKRKNKQKEIKSIASQNDKSKNLTINPPIYFRKPND